MKWLWLALILFGILVLGLLAVYGMFTALYVRPRLKVVDFGDHKALCFQTLDYSEGWSDMETFAVRKELVRWARQSSGDSKDSNKPTQNP